MFRQESETQCNVFLSLAHLISLESSRDDLEVMTAGWAKLGSVVSMRGTDWHKLRYR
jgi:hypothetical protein